MIELPQKLEQLKSLIEEGGAFMSLFDRAMVQRSKLLQAIGEIIESVPIEIDQANEILKGRETIIEEAKQQAGEIVDEAVRRAERLVDADAITSEARKRARELQKETDEYVMIRLEQLEDELSRLLEEARGGILALGGRSKKIHNETVEKKSNLDNR
jgi:hypothetical protein